MKDPKKAPPVTMPIFKLGDSSYTVMNFINYATLNRFQPSGGIKPYPQIRDEYIQSVMYKYYQDHLDSYSEEFRNQMAEFKDGNIFFEIMQQEIWNKAQNDTVALKALYEKNKNKYTWKKSAEAVIFYCSDEATGKFIYDELKKNPSSWRTVAEQYAEKVVADSSRFEWEQLPLETGSIPRAGQLTKPVVNTNDNSASFAYIISVSLEELPRSYAEAKGLVINDYQELLEQNWAASLRNKYPVKINEKVFQQISK
jgi:peptidyl-prolyl cis-trans isomerase SurA